MGVIKRVPRLPSDPFASDTEALNDVISSIQEDNQSTSSEILPVGRFNRTRGGRHTRLRVPAVPGNTAPPPKRNVHGAKKSRRYENLLTLLRETEEDEYNNEVSIEDLVPVIQSARTFTRVICEASMMELWTTFVDCKEDFSGTPNQGSGMNGSKTLKSSNPNNIDPVEAFHGICRKLRTMLKRSPGLGILDSLEEGLLEFFQNQPLDSIYHVCKLLSIIKIFII